MEAGQPQLARETSIASPELILRATDGDKARAAELLGVSLSSLYRRLQRFDDQTAATAEGDPPS
jgi:DNA-binding NtrC family response regulator